MTIVYFTNSSIQSTNLSLFELGLRRLPPPTGSSASVKCVHACGMELWFGMVNILIQRPRMRSEFTALKDCDPPFTWAIARVLPCVGRTLPVESGIQSIWFLKTAVCCGKYVSSWNRG